MALTMRHIHDDEIAYNSSSQQVTPTSALLEMILHVRWTHSFNFLSLCCEAPEKDGIGRNGDGVHMSANMRANQSSSRQHHITTTILPPSPFTTVQPCSLPCAGCASSLPCAS
ncbi:hypothetical protein Ahy_B05g079656 isoform J [Arachis hypogaea]|uniref:Uncharacterized protein n=1 Tax=Arachis hypogaea TaxID=3818 RepID=A0A444ZAH2_ARAHY|nr:hypothetical protein Ahy_B05g079656 isoform J [Arachis hypogaea]